LGSSTALIQFAKLLNHSAKIQRRIKESADGEDRTNHSVAQWTIERSIIIDARGQYPQVVCD